MINTKRTLFLRILATLLLLFASSSVLFSRGEKEAATGKAVGAAAAKTLAGELKIYDTLDAFEKEAGVRITQFGEAPMLKALVDSGKLPPVEERISREPMVLQPDSEIGRYGGTLRMFADSPTGGSLDPVFGRLQSLFRIAPDYKTVVANVAKGWELADAARTLTVYLRKGMKWSDGAAFTADDMMFWYDGIILSEELTPTKPRWLRPGGELATVEKVDDYTVRFRFAVPSPSIIVRMAIAEPFAPKHYLGKYHLRYDQEANKIAEKEGYQEWWQCLQYHNLRQAQQLDFDLPLLNTFVLTREDSMGNRYYGRNPYFYKVDTAGNQLPYIDEMARMLVENLEVRDLKSIAGEFDFVGYRMNIANYTLYKEGEQKGDYRVDLWASARNESSYSLNLTHKDPVLRKLFNDVRFRRAISLAINRDDINRTLFFDQATPRQHVVVPFSVFSEPWMEDYYAGYDTEAANKLLDELGLKWDNNRTYRLRPDGTTLQITMHLRGAGIRDQVCELVKEHWEDVGIQVALKPVTTSLYHEKSRANETDLTYGPQSADDFSMFVSPFGTILPAFGWGDASCYPWEAWYLSEGKAGEEPPQKIKDLFEMVERWQVAVPGSDDYMEAGRKIVDMCVNELYQIGTVGMAPWPVIVKNRLKNLMKGSYWIGTPYRHFLPTQPEQWFLTD